MRNDVLVSICCLTYNHFAYLRKAFDGFLSQQLNFQIEIIVHDDASIDGTQEIIEEYKKKHPGLFRSFLQDSNLYSKGSSIYQIYTQYVLPHANGKYIAICEGDDYWTDHLKLQKQVAFLEGNPDFSICFHQVGFTGDEETDFYEHSKYYSYLFDQHSEFDFFHLIDANFIPNCSTLYRNVIQEFPEVFDDCIFPDWPLHVIYAQAGKIKLMDEVMAIHHKHQSGLWEGIQHQNKVLGIYHFYNCLLEFAPPQYELNIEKKQDSYLHHIEERKQTNIESVKKIDTQKLQPEHYKSWNQFVEVSMQGDVFSYTWWLEIMAEKFDIIVVYEKGKMVAGMALAWFLGKINEPPLTRTLGPLFINNNQLNEHKRTAKERKWLQAILERILLNDVEQFCTSHTFKDWLAFRWNGYDQRTRYTYIIHYKNKGPEDLWRNLNKGTKKSINKAHKNKIKTRIIDSIETLYEQQKYSYKRQGLNFHIPLGKLKELDNELRKRNQRVIFATYDKDDNCHAAMYVVYHSKSAYALLMGGNPQFRNSGAHSMVKWDAINFFHDKVDHFNFGGSDIDKIEPHIRGFGGKQTPYFHIYTNKPVIKEVEIIKNHYHQLPPPPYSWKYHSTQVLTHSWSLMKKIFGQ